ncbi:response regulator [Flavobacterium pallidum]|uniref:Response regulator n=1 Tax=Flavobacterium pallidum TaxID=2172098 RepID=A0A2S1SIU0_9FLAO|nr:response regulator [Flavobacterium pallidum]AWI26334.1 response regulator [Flavobacterium pallidum]
MKYNTVLIIDDDWEDIAFFMEALTRINPDISCIFMVNPEAALSELQNGEIIPDIIFLDIHMDGMMNGFDFLKLAKDMNIGSIPIYMLSGSSEQSIKAEADSLGATGFMTKPSDFNTLVMMLQPLFAE